MRGTEITNRRWHYRYPALVGLVFLFSACGKKEGEVRVLRHAFHQPAIQVSSARDSVEADRLLMEAQGYEVAKDRFLQMDLLRRVNRGRLSEIFGDSALEEDKKKFSIGLAQSVVRSEARLKQDYPWAYALVEAYASGVNRYLAELGAKDPDVLNTYRRWTRNRMYEPKPWEPADSIAIAEGVAFYLSANWKEKLVLGQLAVLTAGLKSQLPDDIEKFGQVNWTESLALFDTRAIEDTFILPSAEGRKVEPRRVIAKGPGQAEISSILAKAPSHLRDSLCSEENLPLGNCFRNSALGSNNWVVQGNSRVYLANDPHLPLTYPASFYEVALDSTAAGGSFRVRGVNLPGLPGVLIGHNDHVAWGFTNQPADVDDVYVEVLNEEGTHVKFRGEWVKLEQWLETLPVRQQDGSLKEESFTFRWVPHHGPILSDHSPELQKAVGILNDRFKTRTAISYKWVGHRGTTEAAASLNLNRARDFEQFKNALRAFHVGAQNVIYADNKGNIGYFSHGLFPVRKYLSPTMPPNMPLLGTGGFEWEPEFRASVPELFNPPVRRIVTANNDPYGHTIDALPEHSESYFGIGYATGIRAKRITELLEEEKQKTGGEYSLQSMRRVQTDHKDLLAQRFINTFLTREQVVSGLSPEALKVVEKLKAWDGFAKRDRNEPVLNDAWMRALAGRYFGAVKLFLNEESFNYLSVSSLGAKSVYHRLSEKLARNATDRMTLKTLQGSLEDAAKVNHRDQRWGQVNKVQFYSPLSQTGILPQFVNIPLERDGSWETVDVSVAFWAPNFRFVVEITPGQPMKAINVLPGGNGTAGSEGSWLKELLLWRDGEYREMVPFVE